MEDLVIYAIDCCMKLGVKYVEAGYHRIDEFSIKSRNGAIVTSGIESSEGIGIRVLVDGALVFSSTDKLDRESIRVAVENAYRDAKNRLKLMRRAKNIC